MERLSRERDRPVIRRLDLILLVVSAALALTTAAIVIDPGLSFGFIDRSLDVAINSLAVLAGASLSALALARYRESGQVAGLFQSSAFLLMAWINGVYVAVVVLKIDGLLGLSLGLPEQLPLYVWTISRVLTAALFVAGAIAAFRPLRTPPRVSRVLLLPIVALSALTLVLYPLRDFLPAFIDVEGIQTLIEEPRIAGALPGATPVALLLEGVALALFVVGILAYRRSHLNGGRVADAYLAVALVLGAFAEIHAALYPGVYSALVTTVDALRLAFFLVLLISIYAESRSDLRALRSAYAALDRLRLSEAERATLEERARLARELHDGLSQDLWFAKLKHERLVPQVPDEVRELATEVTQALDAAIAEAKQAVATMRAGTDRHRPLHDLLGEAVEDFGERSGLRADFSAADLPPSLPPRTQAEVLRVLQEALTNVRKHADATVVRVNAEVADRTLVLRIHDNGRGFRVEDTSGDGMGLQGMRERARLMGGELQLFSEPSGGTTVELAVPLSEAVAV
ncbi:MAG TPA: sensor histidine kinase [Candidatus Caenarcaniphilales bacterium]|nr:sensor histidine kinase [Candidatus Caenarcaniphilales bacterium]